jgi:hypothetical protein
MALIYKATLKPSKLELLHAWLPSRPWVSAAQDVRQVGAYRFDDPVGEVGIETFLLQAGDGSVLHVPLTYRGAPLSGAEEYLIGLTEHSVLGPRWVYDGCGDPVWATALVTTVLTGGSQVEELVDTNGRLEAREPTMTVWGSGTSDVRIAEFTTLTSQDEGPTTVVRAGVFELVVVRVIGAEVPTTQTLTGRWAEGGPVALAGVNVDPAGHGSADPGTAVQVTIL